MYTASNRHDLHWHNVTFKENLANYGRFKNVATNPYQCVINQIIVWLLAIILTYFMYETLVFKKKIVKHTIWEA